MGYKEKCKNHKKVMILSMFMFSILVNGGFFPIVNFNPDSPDMEILMRLIIIVMAVVFHKSIGSLEAVIFEKWSMVLVGILNCVLIICGLLCRYLIEFGEVSITYYFTLSNIAFQMIVLALVSTIVYVWERKKNTSCISDK